MMPPLRAEIDSLRATVALKDASPCPEVERTWIHPTSERADQVQSRAALTVTTTLPPSGETVAGSAFNDAAHRTPVGPPLSTEVDPHAHVSSERATSVIEVMTRVANAYC